MKFKISYRLFIVGILELTILNACENPLDGFQLLFKEPIEKSKLEIRFSSTTRKLPGDIKLQIVGKEADKIVSNLNTKSFKISKEGVIFLAVEPDIVPSVQAPVGFTVTAEAEGFTKVIREFIFTNTSNQFYYPKFFSINNSPGGVSADQFKLFTNTSGEITKPLIITTNHTTKQENAFVKIQEGTALFNIQNQIISGDMAFVIHHFDNRSGTPFIPEGGLARNPVDSYNNFVDAFNFSRIASFASIEISSDKHDIARSFSKPIAITFELNSGTQNPDTKAPIKAGDIIPLISYNTYTGIWKIEGSSTVVKNSISGKLECTSTTRHPAYLINGWIRWLCKQGPTFTIKSNFKDVDLTYNYSLTSSKTGNVIASNYVSLNNNSVFKLNYLPKDSEEIKLQLFDYNNIYGGNRAKPIAESMSLKVCENKNFTIDISSLPVPPAIEVEFEITCPKGKTVDKGAIPSQLKTQFSEPEKNQWINMPSISKEVRVAKTYMLQLGKRYDLRASTDGGVTWPYKQNNYLIDKKKWAFEILGDELGYCK